MEEYADRIQKLAGWVEKSRKLVFFGGAGVSTESGIPDFRSQDGLYHQSYQYPPETILSRTFFIKNPEEFFRFYREKMVAPQCRPNRAHQVLAQWEQEGRLSAVITQNIDGLHQMAGSQNVLELHGSVHRNRCKRCGKSWPLEKILGSEGVAPCSCGGTIKPEVVLYEEPLDQTVLLQAVQALEEADLLIVGGTSLVVYPAAGLLRYFGGSHLVLINRSETSVDGSADLCFRENIGRVLDDVEKARNSAG